MRKRNYALDGLVNLVKGAVGGFMAILADIRRHFINVGWFRDLRVNGG